MCRFCRAGRENLCLSPTFTGWDVDGGYADFCVVDCKETWTVTPATLRGKSRNCAFIGETLTGRVRLTVMDGARRYERAGGEG